MAEPLNDFINTLANNKISSRQKEITEDIDNKEQVIKDLEEYLVENEQLPDSFFDFQINGFTSPVELEDYLANEFENFKITVFGNAQGNTDTLITEVLTQINNVQNDLKSTINYSGTLDDISLNELFTIKLKYVDQTIKFLQNLQSEKDKSSRKRNGEIYSYKWLKGDDTLTILYERMKTSGLISKETQQQDFISVFSQLPASEIKKPVQWEQGPKLFAYFFEELTRRKLIPNTPKWVILEHFFTYYDKESGKYLPAKENFKQLVTEIKKLGSPKDSESIDTILDLVDIPN